MEDINFVSFTDALENQKEFFDGKLAVLPFYYNGNPLSSGHARWGMTALKAGTMRFRWNEKNPNRILLEEQFGKNRFCPLQLIHSKIIYSVERPYDLYCKEGDGIIVKNLDLIPTVTVADCVPIMIYDKENRFFCTLHSGWKGTGICSMAVEIFLKDFGSKIENLCAAIGPHIESCYYVDEERAQYFENNFGKDCITIVDGKKRLSLLRANLNALIASGFNPKNIIAAKDCTYSSRFKNGEFVFGSCRRQTEGITGLTSEDFSKKFTVQAAFCGMI